MKKIEKTVMKDNNTLLRDFRKLFKDIFGNTEVSGEDGKSDEELNRIIAEQDNNLIKKYEAAIDSNGNKAGGKKGGKVKVQKSEDADRNVKQVKDRLRDEER